jgi:hypothetical protein
MILLIAIITSGCAAAPRPLPQMEAFHKLPEFNEKLTAIPDAVPSPIFVVVEDKTGTKWAALNGKPEQDKFEKLKAYVEMSSEYGKQCKASFDDSQSRSKSVVALGKATEDYANFLSLRIEEQRQSLEDEKNGRFWDNAKNIGLQLMLSVALGLALF